MIGYVSLDRFRALPENLRQDAIAWARRNGIGAPAHYWQDLRFPAEGVVQAKCIVFSDRDDSKSALLVYDTVEESPDEHPGCMNLHDGHYHGPLTSWRTFQVSSPPGWLLRLAFSADQGPSGVKG